MSEHEEEVGQGNPKPASFDEDLVEEVGLLGEVGGRKGWVVGLLSHDIRRSSRCWVKGRVEGTYEESCRVEGQEEGLHHGWDER